MTLLGIFKLYNMPVPRKICFALASGFNNICQVLCELLDNSASNLMGHAEDSSLIRTIRVIIRNQRDSVEVIVEDGGTGILNMNEAFTLCGTEQKETPLNASGCGFKNSFAYIESNGGSWTCCTRTREDAAQDRYQYVHGPYDFGNGVLSGEYLPGWVGTLGKTGTIMSVKCPMEVFATVNPTMSEKEPEFAELVAVLREHLRYTYAALLKDGTVELELIVEDGTEAETETLAPLNPNWDPETWKEIPAQTVNLGSGDVEIHCQYGNIIGDEENLTYYRGNMEGSGAEICINGRVIEHSLMKRIWGRKVHPSQNAFLVRVNLVAKAPNALPMTKAAKSGFREEDPRLKKLFRWIRTNVELSEHTWKSREKKLISKLAEKLNEADKTTRATPETGVFRTLGLNVRADMMSVGNNEITIYEGKLKNTQAIHVYQLRMYWDGAVQDGMSPKEGILVASNHPEVVQTMVKYMNKQTDADGHPYNFRLTTWEDEGISMI